MSGRITARWQNWLILKQLATYAADLPEAEVFVTQVHIIENKRQLLDDPDAILPLCASLTQLLREELNRLDTAYTVGHAAGMKRLTDDANWQQLDQNQRHQLLAEQSLQGNARPAVEVQTTAEVLNTLATCTLDMFRDKVAAMQGRFDKVLQSAAELCEPEVQFVQLPRRTLKTPDEIDAWVDEAKQQLREALQNGPIVIR